MRRRLLLIVPLLVASGSWRKGSHATDPTCRAMMQNAARKAFRLGDPPNPALGEAVALTFEAVRRHVARVAANPSGDRSLEHIGVEWIPGATRATLLRDSTTRGELARALATIMGSPGGFSGVQARAAADLYRAWRLPPWAALVVLADPMVSMRGRLLALDAVPDAPGLPVAAVSALCSIDARDRGVRNVVGAGGFSLDAPTVLNGDEGDLLLQVINRLRELRHADSTQIDTELGALPVDSRVRAEVEGGVRLH